MPPICGEKSRNSIKQEGWILLVISNLENKKIPNINYVAAIYNIPRTTLYDWLKGIQ
jgi:hypothetical protein